VDAKYIKCLLEWWKKHEIMFSIIGFLAKHTLEIVKFQIPLLNSYQFEEMSLTIKET
jgi:hypothetical protein